MNAKTLYVDPWGHGYEPHPTVAPRSDLIRVGVDLDGTLAHGVWSPSNPTDEIGLPIWANLVQVQELFDAGFKIWIWTARPDSAYESIESWCSHYGVPISGIITGKPLMLAIIDDRAIHEREKPWIEAVAQIIEEH